MQSSLIISKHYFQEDDDLAKWKKYWCVLKNLKLDFWSSSDDVEVTDPLVTIPVTKVGIPFIIPYKLNFGINFNCGDWYKL